MTTKKKHKIAFIEHYDSFSYNVLDWLIRAGLDLDDVFIAHCDDRNSLEHAKNLKIPLVLSPGPHHPKDLPLTCELVRNSIDIVPILGICLGHQILAFNAGVNVIAAKEPWHGRTQPINILSQSAIFADLPASFTVACYNSLTVDRSGLEKNVDWQILAENPAGEVMAMMKRGTKIPTWSVQFHPESFMSEHAGSMAKNWIKTLAASG